MTKLFDKNTFSKSNSSTSSKGTKYIFDEKTENEINKFTNEIAGTKLSAMSPVRTTICITLDLSGSMTKLYDSIKFLFTRLSDELMTVGRSARQYTLIIMVICNGEPYLGYIGDLKTFKCKEFVESLPKPYGTTPLAKSFRMADEIVKRLYDTLEENKHWYTIPVFFTITDSAENGSEDDCTEAIMRYSKDIQDGKKIFIEFVTGSNPNGLNLGGYKVYLAKDDKEKNKQKIDLFVDALRTASSSDVKLNDTSSNNKPLKSDREAFNRYYSDIMLFNFKMCFDRLKNNGEM